MERGIPDPDSIAMADDSFPAGDVSQWIAVLPLGATEQHGPHLPPQTDTLIAEAIAGRLKARLHGKLPVTFLDAEPVGYSPEHLDWPETRSLGYSQAIDRWIHIGESLADKGIRKLMLLNAHGGNSPLMAIVATELRVRRSMLCVATSWTRFDYPEDVIRPEDAAMDIHAGMIETSVMLALHPGLVAMDKAEDFFNAQTGFVRENRFLAAYGRHAFGWKMGDLNQEGAAGNALLATAEKGEKLLNHAVEGLETLLQEMADFDLSRFGRQG